jgi:anaerobic selenocysteine-containing dehydrogenase
MKSSMLRRDVLKFAGGSVAGLLATPVPWRLATDAALWSQNWSWIPVAQRGEPKSKFTHCALCPAGCAAKARCVDDRPISLTGAGVALCPFGLTVHQLPYHPARLKQALRRGEPVAMDAAVKAIGEAVAKSAPGEVGLLDLRPGRTASLLYRRALAGVPGARYFAPAAPTAGVDLEKVRAILSFGEPVLDGWGTPGRIIAMRDRFKLVQVEPVESRSAALADLWLAARPGTEPALAQALAELLAGKPMQGNKTAEQTGVDAARIDAAAKLLAESKPALVLGDGPEAAALNRLLDAPLVEWKDAPAPKEWQPAAPVAELAQAPDHSLRILFIDETLPGAAIPWSAIERKLVRDNPLVVTFACSRMGYARYAEYVLPAPVPSEAEHDPGVADDAVAATFRIATPLSPAPAGLCDPVATVLAACGAAAVEKPLEARARAIHQGGRGQLVTYADAKSTPLKEVKFDDFWKALNEGGRWEDVPGAPVKAPAVVTHTRPVAPELESEIPLTVVVAGPSHGPAAPLLTKIYQESGLRQGSNQAAIHPDTARQCGLPDGARAMLQTRCGKCDVRVLHDPGVMPGVVQLAAGPTVLDVCGGSMARAKVVRV